MKKSIIFFVGSVFLFASCSTSLVSRPTLAPATPDYVVRERSTDSVPDWFSDFSKWKAQNDGRGYIHFIGESGDVNDRISGCELAIIMAKKKIAEQLNELINSKTGSAKNGGLVVDPLDSDDKKLNHSFESAVATKSLGLLTGVEDQGIFWERRDYSIAKGNSRVYSCAALVRISEKDYKNILKKSQESNANGESKEIKSIVSEAFKN